MSDVDYRLSDVDCRVSDVDYRLSDVDCRVSDVDYRVSDVDCRCRRSNFLYSVPSSDLYSKATPSV